MFKKRCSRCGEKKKKSGFYKNRLSKDGFRNQCKECITLYLRTERGLIFQIYGSQKCHSKERGHPIPSYSKEELMEWTVSQNLFHELYNNWIKSGYKKDEKPSVDRIDDYLGYTFDNIQLMTWGENRKKGHNNNKQSKAVLQFSKDGVFIQEYLSMKSAGRGVGISRGNISRVCSGKRTYAGGYIWRYSEDCS